MRVLDGEEVELAVLMVWVMRWMLMGRRGQSP